MNSWVCVEIGNSNTIQKYNECCIVITILLLDFHQCKNIHKALPYIPSWSVCISIPSQNTLTKYCLTLYILKLSTSRSKKQVFGCKPWLLGIVDFDINIFHIQDILKLSTSRSKKQVFGCKPWLLGIVDFDINIFHIQNILNLSTSLSKKQVFGCKPWLLGIVDFDITIFYIQ